MPKPLPQCDLPEVIREIATLRQVVAGWRGASETVALVPTMGALHAGHLALVAEGRRRAQRVVTSIFVNPTQFAPTEDFGSYPRTFERDRSLLAEASCDVIWAPTVAAMYPTGFATRVVPAGVAEGLESDFRPQFFAGVATVCCKLFTGVAPDFAIFGEKDYQQLQVVRQMVRDLDLPVEIVGYPTVREPDGLAMSSRNAYLSQEERAAARVIHREMQRAATSLATGATIETACAAVRRALLDAGFRVDYVDIRNAETLAPVVQSHGEPLRLLIAAWLGQTRLIDNLAVGGGHP